MSGNELDQAIRVKLADDPYGEYGDVARAVAAVLDLHQPYVIPGTPNHTEPAKFGCGSCYGNGGAVEYPCETVEAIVKELGINT